MDNYAPSAPDISSPALRKERKKVKTTLGRHFQVGYIHNQRSIMTMFFFFLWFKTHT